MRLPDVFAVSPDKISLLIMNLVVTPSSSYFHTQQSNIQHLTFPSSDTYSHHPLIFPLSSRLEVTILASFFTKQLFAMIRQQSMKKRIFFIEHIVQVLLLSRAFCAHLIPLQVFLAAISVLMYIKYQAEGYTPLTLLVILCLLIEAGAQMLEIAPIQYASCLIGGLLYFFPLQMYWLPENTKPVGFRDQFIEENLHYFEFYPLQSTKGVSIKSIKWSYAKQIPKMVEYRDYSNRLIKKIAHMILSYAEKHQLKIGEGLELKTDRSIALSHGKGGTPLFYSSLMMHFAAENFRVGGVQHTEQTRINLTTKQEIKRYRQQQVKKRAEQYIEAIRKLDNQRIVLMGHSYGSATVLQAYFMLQDKIKSKVTHLILLDPWLFPIPEEVFNQKLTIPVLILANQDFVHNEDAYFRNKRFSETHSVEYLIWQGAHHLHQTDVGFINGNLLGMIKNSSLSKEKLQLNIQAIGLFLQGEKVEGRFGDKDLGRNYRPERYHKQNLAVW